MIEATSATTKRTYTVSEAAEQLGIGRSAAYEAARTGQIPTIRIGKRILVPVAALERLLSEAVGSTSDAWPEARLAERKPAM